LHGHSPVTHQAKRADIVDVALSSALGYGENMIRIPEASARASFKAPVPQESLAIYTARVTQFAGRGDCIDAAAGADAPVALKHLFAKVGRLRTQLPLMNTIFRAKCEAAAGNFERTPPTEAAAIRTAGDGLAINPSTFDDAHGAHISFLSCCAKRGMPISQRNKDV
jgi:hypothetical protein